MANRWSDMLKEPPSRHEECTMLRQACLALAQGIVERRERSMVPTAMQLERQVEKLNDVVLRLVELVDPGRSDDE